MDVNECLNTRLTIREFKPDRVSIDVTRQILEAGRGAPSSRNRQPWQFVVITDSAMLKQIGGIATSGPFIADAPMAIAVFMRDAERPDLDAGRAIQQNGVNGVVAGIGHVLRGLSGYRGGFAGEADVGSAGQLRVDYGAALRIPAGFREGHQQEAEADVGHRSHGAVRVSVPWQIDVFQQFSRSRAYDYRWQRRVPVSGD